MLLLGHYTLTIGNNVLGFFCHIKAAKYHPPLPYPPPHYPCAPSKRFVPLDKRGRGVYCLGANRSIKDITSIGPGFGVKCSSSQLEYEAISPQGRLLLFAHRSVALRGRDPGKHPTQPRSLR